MGLGFLSFPPLRQLDQTLLGCKCRADEWSHSTNSSTRPLARTVHSHSRTPYWHTPLARVKKPLVQHLASLPANPVYNLLAPLIYITQGQGSPWPKNQHPHGSPIQAPPLQPNRQPFMGAPGTRIPSHSNKNIAAYKGNEHGSHLRREAERLVPGPQPAPCPVCWLPGAGRVPLER